MPTSQKASCETFSGIVTVEQAKFDLDSKSATQGAIDIGLSEGSIFQRLIHFVLTALQNLIDASLDAGNQCRFLVREEMAGVNQEAYRPAVTGNDVDAPFIDGDAA